MTNTKEVFKQFLVDYVSRGHTVSHRAMKELNKLTDKFVNNLSPDYYFDEYTVIDYLETMKENLSDKNRGFFGLLYQRRYYIEHLENLIKRLIENGSVNDDDSDESNSDTV